MPPVINVLHVSYKSYALTEFGHLYVDTFNVIITVMTMDIDLVNTIRKIHATRANTVVYCSGAGANSISWLLGVSGASRTVLESLVPYSNNSLIELLGYEPTQFFSKDVSVEMSRSAYERGVYLREGNDAIVGVGCTAAISTDRLRHGDNGCFISIWSSFGVTTYSLTLDRVRNNRDEEENIVARLIIKALSQALNIEDVLALDLTGNECLKIEDNIYKDQISALMNCHIKSLVFDNSTIIDSDRRNFEALLPGSFNPVHDGHKKLAQVASDILGSEVVFELSLSNVDKPVLNEEELRERISEISAIRTSVVTWADTFQLKSELFPGALFVIGVDTAMRILDPKYYDGQEVDMLDALNKINKQSCRFLVAGRRNKGQFCTIEDVNVPYVFKDMFQQIPEDVFRLDISSTQMRC